jgi:hypothetical protein
MADMPNDGYKTMVAAVLRCGMNAINPIGIGLFTVRCAADGSVLHLIDMESNAQTKKLWPHDFTLLARFRIAEHCEIELEAWGTCRTKPRPADRHAAANGFSADEWRLVAEPDGGLLTNAQFAL